MVLQYKSSEIKVTPKDIWNALLESKSLPNVLLVSLNFASWGTHLVVPID